MKERKNDFSQGSIARSILALAVPMTVAQLTVVLYNVVDRMFIGHIPDVGRDALTGIGLVMPVVYIITAFSNLSGMGGAPLFSIARGHGDDQEAQRIMGNAFVYLLVLGAALMAVFYLFLDPILYLVGGSDATVVYGRQYLLIYLIGTIPVMLSLGMNPFINAQGFGRTGMMTVLLGAVLNTILDPIFIFLFHMGIAGAALATVISQLCSAVWVLRFLTGQKAILPLTRRCLGFHLPLIGRITSLGLSGFTFSVTNSLVQGTGNALLQHYGVLHGGAAMGDLYVSAMTVTTSVREIFIQPIQGLTQGAQPVLGYNFGAGQYSRVRQGIRFVTLASLGYSIFTWALIMLFPKAWIMLFNDDPALLDIGVRAIQIFFCAYFAMAFQSSGQHTFVALGYARKAVFFSLFRKVILVIPAMYLLSHLMGPYGVFAAEPVSNVIGGAACYITMMLTVWRQLKQPDHIPAERA